ncbi:hypothetical protein BKA65DRAFT_562703 [Rhexocercosporidium sp. MPI-PUGE-AT-0058]|nr:hypothetical protein BKA65DRAFT_562703 [Rhexocercosporidium sp. MPI-PUGE-AT-0058]
MTSYSKIPIVLDNSILDLIPDHTRVAPRSHPSEARPQIISLYTAKLREEIYRGLNAAMNANPAMRVQPSIPSVVVTEAEDVDRNEHVGRIMDAQVPDDEPEKSKSSSSSLAPLTPASRTPLPFGPPNSVTQADSIVPAGSDSAFPQPLLIPDTRKFACPICDHHLKIDEIKNTDMLKQTTSKSPSSSPTQPKGVRVEEKVQEPDKPDVQEQHLRQSVCPAFSNHPPPSG